MEFEVIGYPQDDTKLSPFLQERGGGVAGKEDRYTSPTMNRSDPHELWEHVLAQVELSVSPANFNTWFKESSIVTSIWLPANSTAVTLPTCTPASLPSIPELFAQDAFVEVVAGVDRFGELGLEVVRGLGEHAAGDSVHHWQ